MTHASGISTSAELQQAFAAVNTAESNVRIFCVKIVDEKLQADGTPIPKAGSEQEDFTNLIPTVLEPRIPVYVCFRLDNEPGWLLASYVPDGSTVRDRMLYASTRETLKKELGYNNFSKEVYATQPDELSWEVYQYKVTAGEAAPVSVDEQIKQESKNMEALAISEAAQIQSSGKAVRFPMSDEAQAALKSLNTSSPGDANWVTLCVDTEKETVEFVESKTVAAADVTSAVDTVNPRFYFYQFDHEADEASGRSRSLVFVYSCPEEAPIKQKMLYSTVKSAVLDFSEEGLSVVPVRPRLEVREAADLTAEFLVSELFPKEAAKAETMAKPKRAGAGGRRLVRSPRK